MAATVSLFSSLAVPGTAMTSAGASAGSDSWWGLE
jgi:hypothetical protein